MNTAEALRSIRYDLLEYIQKNVKVDFDNALQIPVHFFHREERHIVYEILGRFRPGANRHINGFLVKADNEEVYFLYFQWSNRNQKTPFNKGFWVLSFRILSDRELMALYRRERKMLVNMTLKRIVDFHGHLCPELVIGAKACEYAQKLFSKNCKLEGGISVIAENCTSALDAIQILLGATAGNQRLKIFDFGKHNYTFLLKNEQYGFRLAFKEQKYGDKYKYEVLEEKIIKDHASLDDVVNFQDILDNRVKRLLVSPFEDLFFVEHVSPIQPATETPTLYLSCWGCGQQVLKNRVIEFESKIYCIPCFQLINTGCINHNLH